MSCCTKESYREEVQENQDPTTVLYIFAKEMGRDALTVLTAPNFGWANTFEAVIPGFRSAGWKLYPLALGDT